MTDQRYQRERTAAFLHSAREQLERSDDLLAPEQRWRRVTYIGRAVDDALDTLALLDRRLTALEEGRATTSGQVDPACAVENCDFVTERSDSSC